MIALRPALVLPLWVVDLANSSLAAEPTAPEPPAFRPKVGLILSGGGARGISHSGVLEVLEELRIAIDSIAATSMGAVPASYLAGYLAYGHATNRNSSFRLFLGRPQ